MSDNFCVIPWVGLASKPTGTARICCLMNQHSNGGILKDENEKPYNFKDANFLDIYNSKTYRDVRLAILKNEKHDLCKTCWIREESNNRTSSRRIHSNKMYSEFNFEKAKSVTDSAGSSSHIPSYYDLRFGNLCNLKCVMCHPSSSNMWYEDYVLLNNKTSYDDGGSQVNLIRAGRKIKDSGNYNWWQEDVFWNNLEENMYNIKHLYFVGGEPMLIEPHYNFLQKLIDANIAKNIRLEYDTNLTNVHQRAINLWKHFEHVELRVSLEDYGKQNDYIRFPSKWQNIDKNIKKIESLNLPNLFLAFSITWQVLNSFTVTNLLEYLQEYKESTIRILTDPEEFNVAFLPKDVKIKILEHYHTWIGGDPRRYKKVAPLIKYLESNINNYDEKWKQTFFKTIETLDLSRKTNWKETFPELANVLKKDSL
jgi:organic radical activating enzyme